MKFLLPIIFMIMLVSANEKIVLKADPQGFCVTVKTEMMETRTFCEVTVIWLIDGKYWLTTKNRSIPVQFHDTQLEY